MRSSNSIFITCLLSLLPIDAFSKSGNEWPNQSWRAAVEGVIQKRFADFDKASDKEILCPGYGATSLDNKIKCWSLLVRATVTLESRDKPGTVYFEPMGYNSVGLLQLSKNECKNAKSEAALKNAEANLICGTNKMANLIAKHKRVIGKKGAGAYWSVLREPYRYGKMKLGKAPQIRTVTRSYMQLSASSTIPVTVAGNPALSETEDAPIPPQIPPVRKKNADRGTENEEVAAPTPPRQPMPKPSRVAQQPRRSDRVPAGTWAETFWSTQERGGN